MLAANTLNSANACHNDSLHQFLTTLESLQFISNSSDHSTLLLSLCPYITLFFLSCKVVRIQVKKRTKAGLRKLSYRLSKNRHRKSLRNISEGL